ncbi:MAG: creatininase family protein [Anaerolineae bacterium]|nr:creatininase family protein [Anaerolineae bacterium]
MIFGEQKWTEIPEQLDKVVVVPLGSMEQHGRHLPLLTDTMICQEIVCRAEMLLGDSALFLPMVWAGVSEHHRGFPGTVSVTPSTYVSMLSDIVESLIGSGFKRILLLNAHGGNATPAHLALYEVQMRHRDTRDLWLVFATWFSLAAPQIAALDELDQKKVTHACELETSIILRLRPELVDLNAARGTEAALDSVFYSPDASRSSRVSSTRPFEHITLHGGYGRPELATSEKGESLLKVAVAEVVAFVQEFATWPPLEPR